MSWSDCSSSKIIFLKNIYLFIYLAVLGLSCGMWDLHYVMQDLSLQHTSSLVEHELISCSIWAPEHMGLVAPWQV